MKILLTGITGYIGKRLLPLLLEDGHEVYGCLRDASRFDMTPYKDKKLYLIESDFLDPTSLDQIPQGLDAAYYLIHSMSSSLHNFDELELMSARHFRDRMDQVQVKQVIYLSGIINEAQLSRHLASRKAVEETLSAGSYALTTLRAGIILGSGSASFEIMRDLVEKLPVMIAPKWLNTRSQPIAIRNVLQYLQGVLLDERVYNKDFDIGGPEVLTYKEMLLKFARIRKLRRTIWVVPVMTPKLSSYWLYFITSTSYKLAVNLVDSMKVEIICRDKRIQDIIDIELVPFDDAVRLAFNIIEQEGVISSWTDALSSKALLGGISDLIRVPTHGCFIDHRTRTIQNRDNLIRKLWSIGGNNGWYYANGLWEVRGFLDKLAGGVGLRRGRKNPHELHAGDTLDFWRVLYANKEEGRLLLYAEMKLPGEAWLEFRLQGETLSLTATFRPSGLRGRIYWYAVLPFHNIIFNGLLKSLMQQ